MKSPIHLCLFAIFFAGAVSAQETTLRVDPTELTARRAEHVRDMMRAQIAPLSAYMRQLETLRQQYVREGKTDAALAVDLEMKNTKKELDAANAGSSLATATAPLRIDTARVGNAEVNKWVNVTAFLQRALQAGTPSVAMGSADLGAGDPAPGRAKYLEIVYTINGAQKKKTVKAEGMLDFQRDLP